MQVGHREPRKSALRRGLRIGKLEITSHLATRERTELFVGRATGSHGQTRRVLIKQLRAAYPSERAIESFLEEARIATVAGHPSVVRPLDIGEYEGCFFFTMEHVDGLDLQSLTERVQRVPLKAAVAIVAEVARVLAEVHEQRDESGKRLGLVHRNLSPDNILLSTDGQVKLIDFGSEDESREQNRRGEIAYMAPEQCRLETVDRRADIFALGILLWELTTGSRLFDQDDEQSLRVALCGSPIPRPSSVDPDVPDALEGIIMKALDRDPDRRFPTAGALAHALDDFAHRADLTMAGFELGGYIDALKLQEPTPTPTPLPAPAARSSRRSSIAERATPAGSSEAAPSRKGRGHLILAALVALFVAGGATVAAAKYILPGLVEEARSSKEAEQTDGADDGEPSSADGTAAAAATDDPARKANADADETDTETEANTETAAASETEADSETGERADEDEGPIRLTDEPIAVAQEERSRNKRARRPSKPKRKSESEESDRAEKTSLSSFDRDVEKRRRLAREKRRRAKRKARKRAAKKKKKAPAKKSSAASALLPSQR